MAYGEILKDELKKYELRILDEIDRICEVESVTGRAVSTLSHIAIYPATHYAVGGDKLNDCLKNIENDMIKEVEELQKQGVSKEIFSIDHRVFNLEFALTDLGS